VQSAGRLLGQGAAERPATELLEIVREQVQRGGQPSPEMAQALRRRLAELTHAEVHELASLLEPREDARRRDGQAPAKANGSRTSGGRPSASGSRRVRQTRRKRASGADQAA
jgi:hypothetical protein